jgi:hypothetical protein
MAQVELGCEGDVTAGGAASAALYRSATEIQAVQTRLLKLTNLPIKVKAFGNPRADFVYMIRTEEGGELLGALSSSVNFDLFEVAKQVRDKTGRSKRRPPGEIWNLHVVGVRTAVLPPDSPDADRLLAPWSTSGIVLVPIILGYTKMLFPRYGG